jgi:23S rRNA (uracil1939-C5)-methyltransferase
VTPPRHRPPKPRAEPLVEVELAITRMAGGGDGVGILERDGDRRAVFLRDVAPGDRVRAAVDFSRRPARGRVLALLEPGPGRVPPACPYTATCGGCDWMHLDSGTQAELHVEALAQALPAAWKELVPTSVAASAPLGYRTRARVHVRSSGGRAIVGMYGASSHRPAEVSACVVLHPAVERARLAIPALFEGTHGEGDVQIALGPLADDPASEAERLAVLDVRWPDGSLPAAFYGKLERAMSARDGGTLKGARVHAGEVKVPATVGDPTPWMRGFDELPFRLAPGGFAQASELGNGVLCRRVDELAASVLPPDRTARVLELYAGAGNFTIALARRSDRVTSVESSSEACRAAQENLKARALDAKVVTHDAAAYAIPDGLHLLVLDPPRTGAREVATRLAELMGPAPRAILYVSCDPATLARDLAILAGGKATYRATATLAVEMFPQTSHLESIVLLERTKRS